MLAHTFILAYNAFTKYGQSSSWCKSHALSFRALSRAVSIRSQLKKYMQRFGLPLESCQGDAKRVRRCLVSGYWRNGARWTADGSFRSVRGNKVYNLVTSNFQALTCIIRLYTSIQHRFYLPENHVLDGSFSMRWRKPKGRRSVLSLKSRRTGEILPLYWPCISSSERPPIGYLIMAIGTMISTLAQRHS